MGRRNPTEPDTRLWGAEAAFTAPGQKSAAVSIRSVTWFAIGGTFTGASISLEVSFDGGTTWLQYFGQPNDPLILFAAGAMLIPCGTESGVLMRMSCDAIASGTVAARISGGGDPS